MIPLSPKVPPFMCYEYFIDMLFLEIKSNLMYCIFKDIYIILYGNFFY